MAENNFPIRDDYHPEIPEGDAGILMPAMTMAMVMTALADGPLGQSEKGFLLQIFYAGNRFELTPRKTLTRLQEAVDTTILIGIDHWPDMLQKARALTTASKIELMEACGKIAAVDAPVCKEEIERIDSIASWVGIGPADYARWKNEFRRITENEGWDI